MLRDIESAIAARGEPKILGVTAFPPTDKAPVEVAGPIPASPDVSAARVPGPDGQCPPLKPLRLSDRYEVTA